MKKFFIAVVVATLMPVFTGCLSMIARQELAASQKIEAINFVVEPPAENNFPVLIPDEELRKNIVGTWECSITSNSFSEIKMNGTVATSFNTPEGQTHYEFSFLADGKLKGLVTTEQPSVLGSTPHKNIVKQNGTWHVKNGELYISFFSEEHNETYGLRTITVWRSADSFELQYDPDDYVKMVKVVLKKAKYQSNIKVTNDVEYYHSQSGNTYHINKTHIVQNNGKIFDTKVIVKMSKMIFQRTKLK